MTNPDDAELAAIRSSFCFVIARWRLTQSEVATLLGQMHGTIPTGRILPDVLDKAAERRLRLLVRLDRAMERIAAEGDIAIIIRTPTVGGDAVTPLQAFADERVVRAMISMAERPDARSRSSPLPLRAGLQ